MTEKKLRYDSLDMLRGLAVLLMIFAHTVVFFNFNENPILRFISQFGDTVVFTTFLFVSAAVAYITYIDAKPDTGWKEKRHKLLIRSTRLVLGYYFIAFFASAAMFASRDISAWPKLILKILTFVQVPTYSEFFIPFIIFSLSLIPLRKFYHKLVDSYVFLALIAVLAYMMGVLVHSTDIPAPFNYYTSLFAGFSDWFRFPVLQYTPVFLLGLTWGRIIKSPKKKRIRSEWLLLTLTIIAGFLGSTLNVYNAKPDAVYDVGVMFNRWPPSLNFILFGLIFVFFALFVLELARSIDRKGVSSGFLIFLGKNAFEFYFYHIIILYVYRYTFNRKVDSPFLVILLFLGVLLLSSLFVMAVRRYKTKLQFEKKPGLLSRVLSAKITPYIMLVIILSLGAFVVFGLKKEPAATGNKTNQKDVEGVFLDKSEPFWWDSSYKYYSELQLTNFSFSDSLSKDSVVKLELDHSNLASNNKSRQDARDLSLVYFENGQYRPLELTVTNPNTNTTALYFKVAKDVSPLATDSRYYLYYGNLDISAERNNEFVDATASGFEVKLAEEIEAKINVKLNRKWILLGKGLTEEQQQLEYTISTENIEAKPEQIKIEISGREKFTVLPKLKDKNTYSIVLYSKDFIAGTYTIKTVIDGTSFKSSDKNFYVSYPLYLTWSIDYEGFDIQESYLNSMLDISSRYSMPITHLFNPRIYVAPEISKDRAVYLTNWVKERGKKGDEIGMHMHMHFDMVDASGLTHKTEPLWGGRVNGHDVLTTAYNYDEFKQLIEWGLSKFSENGLPKPLTYRAGGWFADLDNLRVLNDTGFTIDTSGREHIVWGINKIQSPWHLDITTRPYQPSYSNQNTDIPKPVMDLWEFPNNGLDSTNNPKEFLIDRFNQNYQGKPLTEAQAVSFMSHPHWFDIYDSPKLHALFQHIDQFKFDYDSGPVLYVTYQQALKGWK